MPKAAEFAEVVVSGRSYRNWETVAVTRSGQDLFSHFLFSAASPAESAPSWAGMKLRIGDPCQNILAGRQVIDGLINKRQVAYDARQHGLQLGGQSKSAIIGRATVDHNRGEFKNYPLTAIANALMGPHGVNFYLKGETSGAEKPFEKVNVQAGETVFAAVERLGRMRNIYLFDDTKGNIVGYRLGSGASAIGSPIADLQEGRNIKSCSAVLDYEGSFSEVEATLQRPGNDDHHGDDARDISGKVENPAVKENVPLRFMGEMPGDKADAVMRAKRENGELIATQVVVNIGVQGWLADDNSLWLEHIGDPVSVYSPMAFPDDRMSLAIQEVTSTQGPGGTESALTLVLPQRFNGGGQVDASVSIPNISGT